MQFEPSKSELIHFKRRGNCSKTLALNQPRSTIYYGPAGPPFQLAPVENARFLGVWLDKRLNFSAHAAAIKAKMTTQTHALTRLAASAWGCNIEKARLLYVMAIRSAIAYGAGALYNPQKPTLAKNWFRFKTAVYEKSPGLIRIYRLRNWRSRPFAHRWICTFIKE